MTINFLPQGKKVQLDINIILMGIMLQLLGIRPYLFPFGQIFPGSARS